MAKATGTMQTFDINGIAEDIEDVISNISPTETPLLTMAKKKKATNTYHQWQTDTLAAATTNRAIEGDDSTYATVGTTTLLGNYWYDRFDATDWRSDGLLPNTVPNLLTLGEQPARYRVHLVRLAVRYRF